MRFWDLSGPTRYLNKALEILRDGSSVLIPMPMYGMRGLPQALERKLSADGWDVCHPLMDDGRDPVDQLFVALNIEDDGSPRRTVSLLRQRLKPGQVLLVSGVRRQSWERWAQFLSEYELASRSVAMFDRPLILLLTEGVPLTEMPERAVAMRVLEYDSIVGELDVLLFVSNLLWEGGKADYRMKIIGRMICSIALWDLNLAEFLCSRRPEDFFKPEVVLRDALDALGMPVGMERTWASGGVQRFDGVEYVHPYILVQEGDVYGELMMRIWAAQAAEVLPALELQRRSLVRRMRGLVTIPVEIDGKPYGDLDDMEIGPLSHVANTRGLSSSIRQTANKLKRLRNSLAHLEALDATDVFDEELYRIGPVNSR